MSDMIKIEPLDKIAIRHRTDKASWGHDFAVFYDELLQGMRYDRVKILELGVKFGSSLRMWEDGFPKAEIIGLDNNWRIRPTVKPTRSKLITCDLSDREALKAICEEHGPFDIVSEDSAHTAEITRNVVETVWPNYVKPTGWLFIEDINSGYKDHPDNVYNEGQINYCMSLIKNLNHSGLLNRCGRKNWSGKAKPFDTEMFQIICRPGIMAIQRR